MFKPWILSIVLAFCLSAGTDLFAQQPSEPFTLVVNQAAQTTPSQSQRLQKVKELRTTKSVYLLRLNGAVRIGDKVKISIPNEATFVLAKTGGDAEGPKNFTWFGVVEGESKGSATLASRNGEISGSIDTKDGVYRLSPLGGDLYAFVKVDERKLPPEEPPSKTVKQ